MPVFNLDKLKAAGNSPPLKIDAVAVYEFGAGEVAWITELTADEREQRIELPWLAHKEETGQEDNKGFRAHVVAACWCQSQAREFVAKSPEQIREAAELLGKQGKAVARMYEMADKLNAIGSVEVEGIEKNSQPACDGNTTSHGTSVTPSPGNSSPPSPVESGKP